MRPMPTWARVTIIGLSAISGGLVALIAGAEISFDFNSRAALLITFFVTPACAIICGFLAGSLTKKR
jgi:tetrahydromethanopterin S-methyltransferase subunit C